MSCTRLAALTLAATTLVVSGCGGSSKPSGTTTQQAASSSTQTAQTPTTSSPQTTEGKTTLSSQTAQLTQAQLIAKTNAICAHLNAKVILYQNPNVTITAPLVVAAERVALAQLSKLTPPASMAEGLKQIIVIQQDISNNTIKLAEYAKTKNATSEGATLDAGGILQKQMFAIAAREGFTECTRSA